MSRELMDLLLSLVPADGSGISNARLLSLLRGQAESVSDQDYASARDALITNGTL